MPHASEDGGAAGEDACSSDELIVFKDEDGGEDVVKRSSDKVTEEKSDLIDLSESEVSVEYWSRVIITSAAFPYEFRNTVFELLLVFFPARVIREKRTLSPAGTSECDDRQNPGLLFILSESNYNAEGVVCVSR